LFYKVGKNSFKIFINCIQFLRVYLIFLAFGTTLYWFLQLASPGSMTFFAPFFDPIKDFTHLFYNRVVTVDEVTIDFSFLVASLVMILVSWMLTYLVDHIEFTEKKYDALCRILKQKAEHLFNKNLEEEYHSKEHQNNKVLILIKFVALNAGKSALYNKDLEVGVEEKQTEALRKFQQLFTTTVKCQTKMVDNSLLIAFTPFSQVDAALFEMETIIKDLKKKFKEEKWQVEPVISVETYAKETEVAPRVTSLKKLHKLALKNEIACLSSFRQRYSLMTNQKYNVAGKGIYKIRDKEETVFCIERISST